MAEAEAARAALTDAHRLYIQAFWARHAISQEDVKLVFKKTLQKYECVFVSFDSGSLQLVPEHTDLEEFTHQCNTALEPLSFKITKVRQGLGEDEQIAWVLVNTKKDSLVLDTSPFKPWQIKILTFLVPPSYIPFLTILISWNEVRPLNLPNS